jgi:UDP-GlcNAc:undecaprenyl-phosphate GlcNAc-1-phosphate transferase
MNMLDGADGLAAGVASIITLAFILLTSSQIDPWGKVLEFSFLGSCVGFLLFNFPPAKIFMGDSGSTVLGFVLAVMSLSFYRHSPRDHNSVLVPLLFAGVPLFDAAFAVVRRLGRGISPFQGDREHFYDLLLKSGWSARNVAFASYAATILLVIVGFFCR